MSLPQVNPMPTCPTCGVEVGTLLAAEAIATFRDSPRVASKLHAVSERIREINQNTDTHDEDEEEAR